MYSEIKTLGQLNVGFTDQKVFGEFILTYKVNIDGIEYQLVSN